MGLVVAGGDDAGSEDGRRGRQEEHCNDSHAIIVKASAAGSGYNDERINEFPPFGARVKLGIEPFEYNDLYDLAQLEELAGVFDHFLERNDAALFARFEAY